MDYHPALRTQVFNQIFLVMAVVVVLWVGVLTVTCIVWALLITDPPLISSTALYFFHSKVKGHMTQACDRWEEVSLLF